MMHVRVSSFQCAEGCASNVRQSSCRKVFNSIRTLTVTKGRGSGHHVEGNDAQIGYNALTSHPENDVGDETPDDK
jgi:hypothetical protein